MVPQHFILCWSWVIADMQSANCKPNRATIVTRMSSCVLIAQIDSKRIRRLSQRKDTEIIRVATAGCLSFLTIRRYNVFMSGAQESLLYSRVETILAGKVADGDLRVGDQLPTEDNLIGRFGVSRITVRRAIQNLVSRGLVEDRA